MSERGVKKQGLEKYRRFALTVLCIEILVCILCNLLYLRRGDHSGSRLYRVEAERVAQELRARAGDADSNGEELRAQAGNGDSNGEAPSDPAVGLELSQYETIARVSRFQADETPGHDYVVKDVDGTLYCIEYVRPQERRSLLYINAAMGVLLIFTAAILLYQWKKVLKPFSDISELPAELARGNLALPVREEKSKYFGRFLWGMDMLRETLEEDRRKELALQREKRTLLLSLSHDIKTPLSAIELYAKALSEHLYDTEEKREEALQGITKNVKDIHKYVDEIARASREDFLNLEVSKSEFYLREVLRELEIYYREKLSVLHTEFEIQDTEDCLLKGDRDRLTEILQNLMENAVKYGDGKYIRVTCEEEEDCRLITVENSGCTLQPEELPHLFDPFYRGSNSDGVSGSGLGLYICRDLARKMDGEAYARIKNNAFQITVVMRKA